MNPAALKANLGDLPPGGALIVNEDAFTTANLNKVGYAANPLVDGSLKQWNLFAIPISTLNSRAARGPRADQQAGRPDQELLRPGPDVLAVRAVDGADDQAGSTTSSASDRSRPKPNKRALKAGYAFGETTEMFHTTYKVPAAHLPAGHLSQHHRQRGDGPGLRGRRPEGRPGPVLRLATRSPRPATSCTSCRPTRTSGSRRSRPRTRSPRSAAPSARATAVRWA